MVSMASPVHVSESESEIDDSVCGAAGNVRIERKFSVADYSDVLGLNSATGRSSQQEPATAASDLELLSAHFNM